MNLTTIISFIPLLIGSVINDLPRETDQQPLPENTEITNPAGDKIYPIAVSFHSECCGVPSATPLFKMISRFRIKYHIKKKIAYDNFGPLGREGEYVLAFRLKELTAKQRTAFIRETEKIVVTMKDKGSATAERNYSNPDMPAREPRSAK